MSDNFKYYVKGTMKGNCFVTDLSVVKDVVANYGSEEICLVSKNKDGKISIVETNKDNDLVFKIKKRIEHMFSKKHNLNANNFFKSNIHDLKYTNFYSATLDLIYVHGLEVTQENFDYMADELYKMRDNGIYNELFERIG